MWIRVVLVEPEGEYNIGFVARLCKNFAVDELYIVNPRVSVQEAFRFSAGGADFLERAKIIKSYDEAISDVDIKIATSSIADNKGDILRKSVRPWEILPLIQDKKVAIIFGRESVGLTREEIFKADFLMYIPANPSYPVLNLSHAVGIILYEIWKFKSLNTNNIGNQTISEKSIKLIDKYSKDLYELLKRTDDDYKMYIALKRSLVRGIKDEEEARVIIHFLRKLYTRIIHNDKEMGNVS
ncbi:RNA methyltransferase [Sulfolobus sp. A20]|uniref:tRNA (cytidine-2'-O-)-methyltransferase TrmJ n=1 Tax=Sulfolobaceae TaxID=118883 RepID=UPI0008461C6D|nr:MULTISPECIES: tRNA (cytidine-2'-O-)-methyltransferase TrmJ [unclassified Sulfolobus]TRM74599.1 RNA methyltransferase [Sulfolobus sp. B5]TRM78316.1 RNA methyltransferase [Sulfolobus sp. A20-N-F8]TRM80339.1 RNA methyltransferase [Sulfolobus sp. D5]TRM84941.1 RNA methyltransferase [Sulfolobus sp. F3]TRM88083.1 RNA methyltransferase [Sulfolobus sp. C3]TRM97766.1 RNA methyltransferase [Sulfolobus sp. F1]TRN00109.1 RNA methyltransferase [Sulfolobus sp. E1]